MNPERNLINTLANVAEENVRIREGYSESLSEEQVGAIRDFSQDWLADFSKKTDVETSPPSLSGPWGDPYYIRMNKFVSDDIYDFERDVLNGKESIFHEERPTPTINDNPFNNPLATRIAELSGMSEEYAQGFLKPKHKEGVKVFFEELIHYIKEIDDTKKQEGFLSLLQKEMFSWSPNIFNEMSLQDQFLITSKANRTPEVQRWFGQEVVGEMVYELSFAPKGTAENICKKVDTLDVTEKIDVLKQCQMLGATAVGDGDWAREGFLVTKDITEHLLDDPNTLVSMLASETLSILEKEYRTPSVGVLKVPGSRLNARLSRELSEDMRKQSRVIESTFAVERSAIEGRMTLQIASDAVGVYDHGFDLQGVGYVDREALQKVSHSENNKGPSAEDIENIKDFFESHEQPRFQEMVHMLSFCNRVYALSKETCEDFNDLMNSDLSHEDYFSLFENIETIENLENDIHTAKQRFMTEAGNKNHELSLEFIEEVRKAIVENVGIDEKANAYLRSCGAEIEEALKNDDIEHAFSQARAAALFFNKKNLLKSLSGGVDEDSQEEEHFIVVLQKELNEKHIEMFQKAEKDYQVYVENVVNELHALKHSVSEVICDDAFVDGFYDFIKKKSQEIEETRIKIEVESIKNGSLFDTELSYLDKYSDEEKELFLRALFDPMIRKELGNDLHIDWSKVPLRSQVHFLEYLVSIDKEQYGALVERLKNYDGSTETLLETFLAAQYGEDYGDIILNIAESEDERKHEILEAYSKLNLTAKEIGIVLGGDSLTGELDVSPEVKKMLPLQVAEAVMRRSKDILNVASELLEKGEVSAPFYDAEPIFVTSIDEVMESLRVYTESLESIKSLLVNDVTSATGSRFELVSNEETGDIQTFHLKMQKDALESFVSVQLRKFGAPFNQHDTEREFDGEARINFLFSDVPMETSLSNEARRNALSLRIDREGKTRKDGNIISNDPTMKEGELSLEIGSVMHDDQASASAVVGRVISVGNYLGLERQHKLEHERPEYYHNRESFAKELGDAETFAHVVEKIRKAMQTRFVLPQGGLKN